MTENRVRLEGDTLLIAADGEYWILLLFFACFMLRWSVMFVLFYFSNRQSRRSRLRKSVIYEMWGEAWLLGLIVRALNLRISDS